MTSMHLLQFVPLRTEHNQPLVNSNGIFFALVSRLSFPRQETHMDSNAQIHVSLLSKYNSSPSTHFSVHRMKLV